MVCTSQHGNASCFPAAPRFAGNDVEGRGEEVTKVTALGAEQTCPENLASPHCNPLSTERVTDPIKDQVLSCEDTLYSGWRWGPLRQAHVCCTGEQADHGEATGPLSRDAWALGKKGSPLSSPMARAEPSPVLPDSCRPRSESPQLGFRSATNDP